MATPEKKKRHNSQHAQKNLSPAKHSVFNLQSAGPLPVEPNEFEISIASEEWDLVWDYEDKCIKKPKDGNKKPANYGAIFQQSLLLRHPGLLYTTTRQPRILESAKRRNVPFAQFWGFCAKKGCKGKHCSTKYKLCMKSIPQPHEMVILTVTKSGNREHAIDDENVPVSRRVTGPIRQLFAKALGASAPSVMERNVYRSADPWDLADQVRPIGIGVARNLKYEARQADFLSKEVMIDLDKRQQRLSVEFPELPAPGYLQEIGYFPFHMPLFNSMQLYTALKLARERQGLEVHIDATGSILSKLDFFRHRAFLYTMVIEGPNSESSLSILDFILDMHDWIRIRNRISSYLTYLNACQDNVGVEIRPIMRVTTDFSWALIKATISSFNNFMSVGTYLNTVFKKTFNIPDDTVHTSNFYRTGHLECIVTLCYSHIMKSFSVNLTRKSVSSACRKLALHCFADMIKSNSHEEFLLVFKHFIAIFGSKYESEAVNRSIRSVKGDMDFNMDDTVDEDRQAWYAEWETELVWEDSSTKQKRPLKLFTGFHEDLSKELEILQNSLNLEVLTSTSNAYFCDKVLDAFFTIYVPVIPLWAEFCFKFHGHYSTKTNGRSEGMFSYYKTHVFENSRLAPGELVENLFHEVVRSYRKHYGMRIPVSKEKRKPGSRNTKNPSSSNENISGSVRSPPESEMWARKSGNKSYRYGAQYLKSQKGFEKHGRLFILRGTFNQADVSIFALDQAGVQCTAIAAISLCYSCVKPISNWISKDLDEILIIGDKFYTSKLDGRQPGDYLAADEVEGLLDNSISNAFCTGAVTLTVAQETERSGLLLDGLSRFPGTKLLDVLLDEFLLSDDSRCVITCSKSSYALIKEETFVYFVDSHSRNNKAQQDPDGVAIVLRLPILNAADLISEILHSFCGNVPDLSKLTNAEVLDKFGCHLTPFNVLVCPLTCPEPESTPSVSGTLPLNINRTSTSLEVPVSSDYELLCRVCNQPCSGAHKCRHCHMVVHVVCGIVDEHEEGYGCMVTCLLCRDIEVLPCYFDATEQASFLPGQTSDVYIATSQDFEFSSSQGTVEDKCCVCMNLTSEVNFCSVCFKFCHANCGTFDEIIMEFICGSCLSGFPI